MQNTSRRLFLNTSVLALGGLASSRCLGANERVRIGVIGLGGRGMAVAKWFSKIPDVEIAYLCDVDTKAIGRAKKVYPEAKTATDLRKVLDDKEIDAITVVTGNHWHALASIWACQAGKDVYVEKPVSHNIWEGRKIVEAARKYGRIVQGGTQQRSDPFLVELKDYLDSGELGEIKYVRCNRYGLRKSIGKRDTPLVIPKSVDYDLWLGPAQDQPIYRRGFHYDWHWDWNTGDGELGNWGPHILDDLRNVVFRDKVALPKRLVSGGGRFGWNDAGNTPNTHFVYMDTGVVPVIMDVHNLPRKKGVKAGDVYRRRGTTGFLVIECENGYYAGGRGGGAVYSQDRKVIKKFSGNGGGSHAKNFINSVKSRKSADLMAEIEETHYSSAWCHLGNLSYRLGQDYTREKAEASVKGFQPWNDVIEEFHTHLLANEVDFVAEGAQMGPVLEVDVEKETLKGDAATPEALALVRGTYRKGYEVPEQV